MNYIEHMNKPKKEDFTFYTTGIARAQIENLANREASQQKLIAEAKNIIRDLNSFISENEKTAQFTSPQDAAKKLQTLWQGLKQINELKAKLMVTFKTQNNDSRYVSVLENFAQIEDQFSTIEKQLLNSRDSIVTAQSNEIPEFANNEPDDTTLNNSPENIKTPTRHYPNKSTTFRMAGVLATVGGTLVGTGIIKADGQPSQQDNLNTLTHIDPRAYVQEGPIVPDYGDPHIKMPERGDIDLNESERNSSITAPEFTAPPRGNINLNELPGEEENIPETLIESDPNTAEQDQSERLTLYTVPQVNITLESWNQVLEWMNPEQIQTANETGISRLRIEFEIGPDGQAYVVENGEVTNNLISNSGYLINSPEFNNQFQNLVRIFTDAGAQPGRYAVDAMFDIDTDEGNIIAALSGKVLAPGKTVGGLQFNTDSSITGENINDAHWLIPETVNGVEIVSTTMVPASTLAETLRHYPHINLPTDQDDAFLVGLDTEGQIRLVITDSEPLFLRQLYEITLNGDANVRRLPTTAGTPLETKNQNDNPIQITTYENVLDKLGDDIPVEFTQDIEKNTGYVVAENHTWWPILTDDDQIAWIAETSVVAISASPTPEAPNNSAGVMMSLAKPAGPDGGEGPGSRETDTIPAEYANYSETLPARELIIPSRFGGFNLLSVDIPGWQLEALNPDEREERLNTAGDMIDRVRVGLAYILQGQTPETMNGLTNTQVEELIRQRQIELLNMSDEELWKLGEQLANDINFTIPIIDMSTGKYNTAMGNQRVSWIRANPFIIDLNFEISSGGRVDDYSMILMNNVRWQTTLENQNGHTTWNINCKGVDETSIWGQNGNWWGLTLSDTIARTLSVSDWFMGSQNHQIGGNDLISITRWVVAGLDGKNMDSYTFNQQDPFTILK